MKQTKLLAHPSIEPLLDRLRADLPPSLLLTGELGIGLKTIALRLSNAIEEVIEPMTTKGEVDHAAGSISVEVIRGLYGATRGKSRRDFVIIIDDADRMTISAQQAFLKLLEEPPAKAHFILTTHSPEKLLPTIRSRVVSYQIPRISAEQSRYFLHQAKIDEVTAKQLLFLAEGRPALLAKLANDPKARDNAITLVRDARTFVTGTTYARFVAMHSYTSRAAALELIGTALVLLKFAFDSDAKKISDQIDTLLAAHEAIAAGGNVKVHLASTVV